MRLVEERVNVVSSGSTRDENLLLHSCILVKAAVRLGNKILATLSTVQGWVLSEFVSFLFRNTISYELTKQFHQPSKI